MIARPISLSSRRLVLAGILLLAGPLFAQSESEGEGANTVGQITVKVEVEGEGLFGPLRSNINSLLQIETERKNNLSLARMRQLHRGAEQQISRALEPFGYYRPTIRSSLEQVVDEWVARYQVDPGPQMALSAVSVVVTGAGANDPTLRRARDEFPLQVGSKLSHPEYERGKQALVDAAAARGYLDAGFSTAELRIDLQDFSAAVELQFETGPQYLFGETRFVQDLLNQNLLHGYIKHDRGTPFDLNVLLELQNALSDNPYFQRVEVVSRLEEAADLEVPIVVNMVPAAAQKWDLGLGYGTDTGARGTVEVDQRRFNRRGHRGEAELTVSEIETSVGARYLIPGAYPRTDVLTMTLAYEEVNTDTSSSRRALAGVGRTRSRGRWREALGLNFERTDYAVGVDQGTSELLIPEASWSRVKADDRLFPLTGQRVQFSTRGADSSLLSNASFVQLTTEAKAVRSLGERARVLGRLSLGRTFTSDFRNLPPTIRFFAGGDQSVRGYAYQSLGPSDELGNIIGGEALLSASLEIDSLFLDFEKAGRFGAAAFFDIGGAGVDLGDGVEQGAGIGLRWLSPIGLVRLDTAWALTSPGSPVRFHIMIGPDL